MPPIGSTKDEQATVRDAAQLMRYASDLARVYKEERAKRAALHIASQTTRRILDSIGDAVLVIDHDRRILDVNPAFCRLAGVVRSDIVDAHVLDSETLRETAAWLGDELPAGALSLTREVRLGQQPGRLLEARLSAYSDEAGRHLGTVWVLRDITAQRRAEETRQEFLAIVSHELRTPLTALLGFSELLEMGAGDEDERTRKKFVDGIVHNTKRLRDNVEQILAFTSFGSDAASFAPEEVDVRDVVAGAIAANRAVAESACITIAVEPCTEPLRVVAAKTYLARAIEQIVDNAVTYNRPGGRVDVRMNRLDGRVIITVQDTGNGIPPAEIGRIFDPFYRSEHFMTARTSGLGLGLALARRVVRWHGGDIDVESRSGCGATFIVTVPVRPPSR